MFDRLLNWVLFNVGFALMPLGIVVLFRYLAGNLSLQDVAASPEILFFIIMISVTALADVRRAQLQLGRDRILKVLNGALLWGMVFVAALYGALVYDNVMQVNSQSFQLRLFAFSIVIGILMAGASVGAEILLSKAEGDSRDVT